MTCSVCPGFGKPACLWPFSCPSTVGLPTEQERALDGDGEDVLVTNAIAAMMDGPLIDPDCRDGKHSSCVGGPCQCPCHELAMRG